MKIYDETNDRDSDGRCWDTVRIGPSPKSRSVLFITAGRKIQLWMATPPPNVWYRFWQWLLLGWHWELVPDGYEPIALKYNRNKEIRHG